MEEERSYKAHVLVFPFRGLGQGHTNHIRQFSKVQTVTFKNHSDQGTDTITLESPVYDDCSEGRIGDCSEGLYC